MATAALVRGLKITKEFEKSYQNFEKYPLHLISEATYGRSSLRVYRKRYRERQSTLFVGENVVKKLPVRDIWEDGSVSKENIFDESQLKTWLGDTTGPDQNDPTKTVGYIATKKDPRCRFV
jgi:hypothetical protein